MKIKFDGDRSKKVWQSDDGKVKIWDVTEENGTTHQTMSEKIAAGGEFDVEFYKNPKSGKTYVRQLKQENSNYQGNNGGNKQFKADPDSRESIEWQTSLKAAVEVVRDYHMLSGAEKPRDLESYVKDVDKVAVNFKTIINLKPKSVTTNADEPPIENRENQETDEVQEAAGDVFFEELGRK